MGNEELPTGTGPEIFDFKFWVMYNSTNVFFRENIGLCDCNDGNARGGIW